MASQIMAEMWKEPWDTVQHSHNDLDEFFYNNSDVRTRDLPFMRQWESVIFLTITYVAGTIVGPRLMENRKAFELKWPMFAYNVAMTLMSLWMFLEMAVNCWRANYNIYCNTYKLSYDPAELRVVNGFYWYFLSKGIEFLDTTFMVLKKKNSQITLLHVWHHSFMFPYLYFSVLVGPCGQAVPGAIINSFIHVVMYGYYALSLFPALHPYLWWKKYLTMMQLIQFFLILASTGYAISIGCDFPHSIGWIELGFLSTLVVLFSNFYIQSYIKRKRAPAVTATNGKASSHTNGVKHKKNKDL